MKLCVIGSIIALILSMHVSLPLMMLIFGLICIVSALGWVFFQFHEYKSESSSLLQGTALYVKRLFLVSICMILTVLYVQNWFDEALSSRLPASLSGMVVEGVGDVVACKLKVSKNDKGEVLSAVEKLTFDVFSIDAVSNRAKSILFPAARIPGFPELQKVVLTRYISAKMISEGLSLDSMKIGCGKRLHFKAKLRAPYSFINPYGFDYEAWLLSKGIDAAGYIKTYEVIDGPSNVITELRRVRQVGIEKAAAYVEISGQVLPALLFGEGDYLSQATWSELQRTGTIHLFIVSGLHVGFLALIVLLIWRPLVSLELLLTGRSFSYLLRLTPLILLLSCLIYSYMAGMGLAVQRAGLMMAVALCLVYSKKHWSVFDTWLGVMWLILMMNPMVSLFVGFWFSFMAVAALLLAFIGGISYEYSWLRRVLGSLLKPQWIVFIALVPYLWLFQQSNSVFSFLINILAIPLLALVILPVSILIYVFDSEVLVALLNQILIHSFSFLTFISDQGYGLVFKPSGLWLLTAIIFVFVYLLPRSFPFRYLSLGVVAFLFILPAQVKSDRLIVFDVGQGLSVYGQVAGHSRGDKSDLESMKNWLYDTGAKYRSGFSLGGAVVANNIIGLSGGDLQKLIISHSDNDHAGGELGLKEKIAVAKILAGQPSAIDHENCHSKLYKMWQEEGHYKWRIFSTVKVIEEYYSSKENKKVVASKLSDNDSSCVVQIAMSGIRVLLPGDIEASMERLLAKKYGRELKSDILVVAHHGSKTSSSKSFLRAVAPKIAIISSGFKNAFNHPHADTLAIFEYLNIPVYNTASSGAVEVKLSDKLEIIEWRKENPPIWRQM